MISITSLKLLNLQPVILISHKGLEAIKHIVSIAPQEAQWFHTVEPIQYKQSPGKIFLRLSEKLYIPKQNTSAAQVDTNASMMMEFYRELQEEYSDQDTINQKLNSMTCWCHSHHNMAPNPSGQDNLQFNSLVKASNDQQQNVWQIMLIFNKKNQFYSRVYDPRTGLVIEGVAIEVENDYDFSYIEKAAKEKFITQKTKMLWANQIQKKSFFPVQDYSNEEDSSYDKDPYDIELDLASDVIFSIYGDCSLEKDAKITNKDVQQNLPEILGNFLDDKELQILYYLLSGTPDKISDIFNDSKFLKNKMDLNDLLNKINNYFLNTDSKVNDILFAFRDVFVFAELPNLKSCKKYIKGIINV